ncbi:hypothetical protein MPSEU_000708900 [Mayamaea pseudoterrestris]|nr:hypothetical protein MPSEU_000708900 [Mayamaea pseudoterrestris]
MDGLPTHFGRGGGQNYGRGSSGRGFRGRGSQRGGGRPFPGRHGGGQRGGRQQQPYHQNQQQYQRRPPFENTDNIEEIGSLPSNDVPCVTIAVEGCCHGQLDAIYHRIQRHEQDTGQTVDLLLCCGDFQSLRNLADFHSLAVPPKYRALGDFHAYYSGAKQAPKLTIFVGGNHEASQALQELPYGGWVAPNIYYLGWAGIVNFKGLRIGGISGIYKSHDYCKGHYEVPPFDRDTLRSVYHVRNVDVHRMLSLSATSKRLDVCMSHDWPLGVEQHGDTDKLLRTKPFFRQEVERNELGSPPNREILNHLKPRYWFSAHLHVKFHATVHHGRSNTKEKASNTLLVPSQAMIPKASDESPTTQFVAAESIDPCLGPDLSEQMTRFLSLDKCLPRRPYLSIVHVPVVKNCSGQPQLEYDVEWLALLVKTHELTRADAGRVVISDNPCSVTPHEMEQVRQRIGPSLTIPKECELTVPPHLGPVSPLPHRLPPPLPRQGNPQTDRFLNMLGLSHIVTVPCANVDVNEGASIEDENEIDLNAGDDDDNGRSTDLDEGDDSKRPRLGSA